MRTSESKDTSNSMILVPFLNPTGRIQSSRRGRDLRGLERFPFRLTGNSHDNRPKSAPDSRVVAFCFGKPGDHFSGKYLTAGHFLVSSRGFPDGSAKNRKNSESGFSTIRVSPDLSPVSNACIDR